MIGAAATTTLLAEFEGESLSGSRPFRPRFPLCPLDGLSIDASPEVEGEEATGLLLDIFEEADESAANRLLIVWLFPPSFNATDFDLLFIIIAAAVAAVLLFSKI